LVETTELASLFHGWIAPGQVLRIGPYELFAELQDAVGASPAPTTALDAKSLEDDVAPRIVLSHGGHEVGVRTLPRALTIVGRKRPSTVRIRNPRISSCHCALYWNGEAMWAVDLLSGNGVGCSGSVVEATRMAPGEPIQVGDMELTLQPPEAGREEEASQEDARRFVQHAPHAWDARIHDLEQQTARLRDRLEQVQEARVESQAEWAADVERLQKAIAERDAAVARDRSAWHEERGRLQDRVAQLSEQLAQARAAYRRAETTLKNQGQQLERGIAEREIWEQERDELRRRAAQLTQRLQEVDAKVKAAETTCRDQLQRFEQDQRAWQKERQAMADRIAQLVEEVSQSTARQAGAEAALNEQIRELMGRLAERDQVFVQESAQWDSERQDLEGRIEQQDARCRSLAEERELSDQRSQAQAVAWERQASERLTQWNTERNELRRQLTEVRERLQEAEAALRRLEPARLEQSDSQASGSQTAVVLSAPTEPFDDGSRPSQDQETQPTIAPPESLEHEPADSWPLDFGPTTGGEEQAKDPADLDFQFEDPVALDRMVRFARQKQGRVAPAVKRTALVALWVGAGAVMLVVVLTIAARMLGLPFDPAAWFAS
jgi:hypothetical protein